MTSYRNDYTSPTAQPAAPVDFHARTPSTEYDHFFAGGSVKEIKGMGLMLKPLIPHLHAEKLFELFSAHPVVNKFRYITTDTLQEVLEWMESRRRNPSSCMWVIFKEDANAVLEGSEPSLECLMGVTGFRSFDDKFSSVELSPLIVFPPFQLVGVATKAVMLLQTYAFKYLKVAHFWAAVNTQNPASLRAGEKANFRKELLWRRYTWFKPSAEALLSAEKDPRYAAEPITSIYASIYWFQFLTAPSPSQGVSVRAPLSAPAGYPNSLVNAMSCLEEKRVIDRAPHLSTPVQSYDFNFGGEVTELRSKLVTLQPFVPSLYARSLLQAFNRTPDLWKAIDFEQASSYGSNDLPRSMKGLLEYFEQVRQNASACAWAILANKGDEEEKILAGFVVVRGDKRIKLGAWIGPLVTLPPFRRQNNATHALALLQRFVFAPKQSIEADPGTIASVGSSNSCNGLGMIRLSCKADPQNIAFRGLVAKLGFKDEGVAVFCIPKGRSKERLAGIGSVRDPRDNLRVLEKWCASVTWNEWEAEQKEKTKQTVGGDSYW